MINKLIWKEYLLKIMDAENIKEPKIRSEQKKKMKEKNNLLAA